MRCSLLLLAGLVLPLGHCPLARADVPRAIPFQAQVKISAGKPITGSTVFTFSLYSASSGGTALWSGQQTLTPTSGLLSTTLGSVTALPASLDQPLRGRAEISVPGSFQQPNVSIRLLLHRARRRNVTFVSARALTRSPRSRRLRWYPKNLRSPHWRIRTRDLKTG